MNISRVRSMSKCKYLLDGECQLFSRKCEENCSIHHPDYTDRLTHIAGCQEEIIKLQKEIIDELFNIACMHISAESEELRPVILKINEAAMKRAEL